MMRTMTIENEDENAMMRVVASRIPGMTRTKTRSNQLRIEPKRRVVYLTEDENNEDGRKREMNL
jgi:hypothetical protein